MSEQIGMLVIKQACGCALHAQEEAAADEEEETSTKKKKKKKKKGKK
jgi:hypothetical protein